MGETNLVTDYKHIKKHMRDLEMLLSEIYNWQCRAINIGYDIPDIEYDHLRDINFRLSDPPKIGSHVDALISDAKFQEEILDIIETIHPRIYERALRTYRAKQAFKEV